VMVLPICSCSVLFHAWITVSPLFLLPLLLFWCIVDADAVATCCDRAGVPITLKLPMLLIVTLEWLCRVVRYIVLLFCWHSVMMPWWFCCDDAVVDTSPKLWRFVTVPLRVFFIRALPFYVDADGACWCRYMVSRYRCYCCDFWYIVFVLLWLWYSMHLLFDVFWCWTITFVWCVVGMYSYSVFKLMAVICDYDLIEFMMIYSEVWYTDMYYDDVWWYSLIILLVNDDIHYYVHYSDTIFCYSMIPLMTYDDMMMILLKDDIL